jgi:hypothetical protein
MEREENLGVSICNSPPLVGGVRACPVLDTGGGEYKKQGEEDSPLLNSLTSESLDCPKEDTLLWQALS